MYANLVNFVIITVHKHNIKKKIHQMHFSEPHIEIWHGTVGIEVLFEEGA